MLDLPTVTLLVIDTANHALALRALARCQAQVSFGRTLFLTDAIPSGIEIPAGVELATIAPIESRADYSAFVLKGLLPYASTAHLLLAQWDGFVVNAGAWQTTFLDCDYIGATWFWQPAGRRVGNGGFSLRSRRLLEALQDPRVVQGDNEDLTIGDTFRPLLESSFGVRFADEATADRFAFEAAHPIGKPFGFHGLFNFCRVMPASELAALAPQFSDAIARSPQLAQLLRNCIAMGQWPAAIAIARRRLSALATDVEAESLLAQAEAAARHAPAAGRNDPCPCGSGRRFKHCHGAIAATPPIAAAAPVVDDIVQSALAAHQRGDLAVAERDYRTALTRAPEHPVALHFLGVIAYQGGRPSEALPLLERAVALRPGEPEFHNNLGLVQVELDRHDDAIDAYGRALAQNPAHATAWCNLGLALTGANRLPEAIDALRRAIALQPDFAEAHWNLALALLADGQYAAGWREYEWRLTIPRFATSTPSAPRWNGEDINGKTLLLRAEQGLGDALHFVRFASVLAAHGARVLVQVQRPLVHLVATVPGVSGVHAAGDPPPRYDAQIELLSVPGKLGIDASNIPVDVPYVSVEDARAKIVAAEVEKVAGTALRVGLSWAGAPSNTNDRRRSCPLATLAPLLDVPGVAWFSLQKGDDDVASMAAAQGLARLDARNDFDGTAALVAALDIVVTVDTSIAHLAGALARPTWILLPFAPDWRWRVAGESSPWYPTARLFRQPRRGDWASVVRAVRIALAISANAR